MSTAPESGGPAALMIDDVRAEIAYFARMITVEIAKFEKYPLALSPTAIIWRAVDNAQRRLMFEEREAPS